MKIERKMEIKDGNDFLLVNIYDHVEYAINRLRSGKEIDSVDIEIIKINRNTIIDMGYGPQSLISNLKEKLDYLIKVLEE